MVFQNTGRKTLAAQRQGTIQPASQTATMGERGLSQDTPSGIVCNRRRCFLLCCERFIDRTGLSERDATLSLFDGLAIRDWGQTGV